MSDIDLKRIKEIRQLQEHGYSDPIPLGSEGQYVDMKSNLDLEQELKLGGNHNVTIIEEGNKTTIKEYYLHKNNSSIEEDSDIIDYIVVTTILQGDQIVETNIKVGEGEEEDILLKISSVDDRIIGFSEMVDAQNRIISEIKYPNQEDTDTYIHKKQINFLNNDTLITQEVD